MRRALNESRIASFAFLIPHAWQPLPFGQARPPPAPGQARSF